MQALIWGVIYVVLASVTAPFFIGLCIGPVGFIISIYWGIKAYQGNYVEIPVISNFVKNQGWAQPHLQGFGIIKKEPGGVQALFVIQSAVFLSYTLMLFSSSLFQGECYDC